MIYHVWPIKQQVMSFVCSKSLKTEAEDLKQKLTDHSKAISTVINAIIIM